MINPELFTQPVTIVTSYSEVMRDPNTFILKFILKKESARKQLEPYMNFSRFECQTEAHNHVAMTIRSKKNLFEWLATKKFNYEKVYNQIYDKYPQMFEDSVPLEMYRALSQAIKQEFVDKIYVYSQVHDKRIQYDLAKTFGATDKLIYANGNYLDVIDRIPKVDLFIDNDIDRIAPLFEYPRFNKSTFMIAEYGYNYVKNPLLENSVELKGGLGRLAMRRKINLVEFKPIKVTKEMLENG